MELSKGVTRGRASSLAVADRGHVFPEQFPAACQNNNRQATQSTVLSHAAAGRALGIHEQRYQPLPRCVFLSVCLPAWPLLLLPRARAGRASMRVTTCGVTRLVSRHSSCCPHRGCCSQVRLLWQGVGTQPTNRHHMQQQQPPAAARYIQCCPCCRHCERGCFAASLQACGAGRRPCSRLVAVAGGTLLLPTGCDKTQGLMLAFQADSLPPGPLLSSCHALPCVAVLSCSAFALPQAPWTAPSGCGT